VSKASAGRDNGTSRGMPMAGDKSDALSFHERAKKFKRGPAAPPESEADRPRMDGGSTPPKQRAEMPEGAPGKLEKDMPAK
jgi:hypothetical protein